MQDFDADFVHLARLSLEGRGEEAAALIRKVLTGLRKRRPELAKQLAELVQRADQSTLTRGRSISPVPIDADSRLELLRHNTTPRPIPEPCWAPSVLAQLNGFVEERSRKEELSKAGLSPTRSMLFTGPPGVGKTLAAGWMASELGRPLLTLDLAAVMSSFLGKTGNNIRAVLDYAQKQEAVLLLDEFDAIAKRRGDDTEIGELKRLVSVLLQSVDDWPATGVLIAATNHPELLDPAVWRRFDRVVEFPLPDDSDRRALIQRLLPEASDVSPRDLAQLANLLSGRSHAVVSRIVVEARRSSVLRDESLSRALYHIALQACRDSPLKARMAIARSLKRDGSSEREIASATGIARDTLRKHLSQHGSSGETGPRGKRHAKRE